MIIKLRIKNFRSIKNVEISLGHVNAFIGPNNAGKSNIMKALNLVLGESYPTVRAFDEKDFYDYDKSNPISIEVVFDTCLLCNSRVHGFQLTFSGENCEYFAIDESGSAVTYPGGREVRVSNEMKEEVALLYLGLDRQAAQQVRPSQWTLYGKLLKSIERQIISSNKENFKRDIQSSYDANIYPIVRRLEGILQSHVKEQTGLDLYLRLSILDPIETIKNLRPFLQENPFAEEFDAEDVGSGTQSALAVAISRAYAEILRRPLVLAIEEPELYLHPHGCRHFYNLLKNLARNGVQIIYTTHERSFVNMEDFQSIHLVRKISGETEVYSGIGQQITFEEELKMASRFNEELNEIFFADYVILVEGPADRIACQLALETLGIEVDKKGISIAECGSNTGIKPIGEVAKLFKIPVYALIDEDPGNTNTRRIISELRSFFGNDNVFLQSPKLESLFALANKPTKYDSLRIFPQWFSNNNPPPVYVELKRSIENA